MGKEGMVKAKENGSSPSFPSALSGHPPTPTLPIPLNPPPYLPPTSPIQNLTWRGIEAAKLYRGTGQSPSQLTGFFSQQDFKL